MIRASDVVRRLAEADLILLEGGGAQSSAIQTGILEALEVSLDDPRLRILDPRAVAQGGLEANRRLHRGEPAYFDFLPQLEINALVQGEARFISLIPAKMRLRGGEMYRADADGEFAIGKGAHQLEFYLIKENFNQARKSAVDLPEISDRQHRISVSVEQSPGQGFAKVSIGSGSFAPLAARPIELDWTQMTVVDNTRDEILAGLQSDKSGAYPDTQVFRGHAVLWHPESPHGAVSRALAHYIQTPLIVDSAIDPIGADALKQIKDIAAKAVNPAYEGRLLEIHIEETATARFLDTDGALPQAVPALPIPGDAEQLLETALEKAATDHERLQRIVGADSDLRAVIGFATWCYRRCPTSIVEALLSWYEIGGRGSGGDLIVRIEGLGRALHEKTDALRFYAAIERRLVAGQPIRNPELAALTRLLGGVADAADWLSPGQANRLLQATQVLIEEQNSEPRDKAYKRKFKFALIMLASLLRRRRVQPGFLDSENSAARTLEHLLVVAQGRMDQWIPKFHRRALRSTGPERQHTLAAANRLDKAKKIISELIYFLHEEGRDPNIIKQIDQMED
jgi:hypothetical protein